MSQTSMQGTVLICKLRKLSAKCEPVSVFRWRIFLGGNKLTPFIKSNFAEVFKSGSVFDIVLMVEVMTGRLCRMGPILRA